jgi:hypothetical protein
MLPKQTGIPDPKREKGTINQYNVKNIKKSTYHPSFQNPGF